MTPRWLDLRVGYRCNQSCRYCDQGTLRETVADLATGEVEAALAEHPAHGVWLAGGEVSLRADLPRLVRRARELGFVRVGIQTNGQVLATAGAASMLRDAGLTDVALALPAASPSLYQWLTGSPEARRRALQAARRIRAAGLDLRITTVLTRSILGELDTLARLAIDLGAQAHRWILARAQGAAGTEVLPRLARTQAPLASALRLGLEARIDEETAGVPLCLLPSPALAADRLDAPPVVRAGLPEAPWPRHRPDVCRSCPLAGVCSGMESAYLARWGSSELRPGGPPPPPAPLEELTIRLEPDTDTRELRQRLVGLAPGGTVVLAGEHPQRAALVRDAERLGSRVREG